jgi:glycosidase
MNTDHNERPVIYQLFVRIFGNTRSSQVFNGTLEQNGCGKFHDISPVALTAIREMGFNYVWLTGVIEQASGTSYPNRPADPPDILKGRAGSPYAIRDYFDVCPDYAVEPERRLEEFRELIDRCHEAGLRVIMDFIPNHVARSYGSDVRPDLSFGEGDNREVFFDRDNHFFYLNETHDGGGPPLKLPTLGMEGCSGSFELEKHFGRVTGNNAVTWTPSIHDWYETVKLNYGHDFTQGRDTSHLPKPDAPIKAVPKTWRTMDEIIAYWQEMGVDGFRADMAHMIPMEFWAWVVRRARDRNPNAYFGAEAYDSDPAKLTDQDVIDALLNAGFDGAYEHPTYKILQGIYESGKWANDLDGEIFTGRRFHQCIRYLENHDEVRIANPQHWGGYGMKVGKPAAAVMFGMSRAAIMMYNGQEIGEPAIGAEGFSGDDGRTSIFDYTAMPEFQKWVNEGKYDGGGLSAEQKYLRNWYADLLEILKQPAFERGDFFGLNYANQQNHDFGHWIYAFLRRDAASGQAFLCVANFHPDEDIVVKVRFTPEALEFLGRAVSAELSWSGRLRDVGEIRASGLLMLSDGLDIGKIPSCGAHYYVLK